MAPESGKYWLIDIDKDDEDTTPYNTDVYIQIDSNNYILLETFQEEVYGDIGVLVTNPDNPRKGRIYLFAHQYSDGVNGVAEYYNNHSAVHFIDEDGNERTSMPGKYDEGGYVDAGDWIGFMGGNDGYKPHVHMEVYEYFSEVRKDHSGVVNELEGYTAIEADIRDKMGATNTSELTTQIVTECINWQRVDPRTVFNQEMFIDNDSAANDTETIINELDNNDDYWPDSTVDKDKKYDQFFKPWGKWTKITGAE